MQCIKDQDKQVLVLDCEKCLSNREAFKTCFQRGFVWGVADDSEPKWELTIKEAISQNRDVSFYFDLRWEGNKHLLPEHDTPINPKTYKKKYIPSKIRWEVWERDNFTCKMCGTRKNLSIDHIQPESKRGTLDLTNLQTLCRRCNMLKGVN